MSKQVCHIIRKFLPNSATFVGNQILHHSNYEPTCLYTEDVFSILGETIKSKYLVKNIIPNDLNRTYYKRTRQITRKLEDYCIDIINERKISIIHGHYGPDYWVFRNIIKKSKLPSLVSFYGYDASGFCKEKFGLGKVILKQVFNIVDICLAMSEDMKNDLLKLGCPEEKIIVHYFGSQIDNFLSINKAITSKIIVLTIASLVPKKGYINILKAIKYLETKSVLNKLNVEFRFIGSGFLEAELKSYIIVNNLGNYVKVLGKIEYLSEEYLKNISEADIFLHPSVTDKNGYKEGIPTSITEAMASGLPVISTFHAGIASVVSNNVTGILLNENDYIGIAHAISKLINNNKLRKEYSINAKKYAIENFDINQNMVKLEKIYNNLISLGIP